MITLTREEVLDRFHRAAELKVEAEYQGIYTLAYEKASENHRYWQNKLDEIDEIEESKK